MISLREHANIAAPVERVFSFMDTPAHQAEITPSLSQSVLIERLPNGGSRVHYAYQTFGLTFSGEVRATDYVPDERIVWTMNGDLQGTIRWYFGASDLGCQLTYAATYVPPGPGLLRGLTRPLLKTHHERELHTLLRNLKGRIES